MALAYSKARQAREANVLNKTKNKNNFCIWLVLIFTFAFDFQLKFCPNLSFCLLFLFLLWLLLLLETTIKIRIQNPVRKTKARCAKPRGAAQKREVRKCCPPPEVTSKCCNPPPNLQSERTNCELQMLKGLYEGFRKLIFWIGRYLGQTKSRLPINIKSKIKIFSMKWLHL